MSLKYLINNLITSGIGHFDDNAVELKFKILNSFSLIGLLSIILSLVVNPVTLNTIFKINNIISYSSILFSFVILLSLRMTKKIDIVAQLTLFVTAVIILFAIYTGLAADISIIWILILPALSFFLTDRKKGIFWSIFPLVVLWGFVLLKFFHIIRLDYPFKQIAEVNVAYIEIALLTYMYAFLLDSKQKSIHEKNISLESAVGDLNKRNKELDEAKTQLQQNNIALHDQLAEIKNLNDTMIGRELKMAELKKEISYLKEQQHIG